MAVPKMSSSSASSPAEQDAHPNYTLHVCTSCRTPGVPRQPVEGRPGFILYERLLEAIEESALQGRVEVRPAKCLSICPRPCGIALSSPGSWTYLFGDQLPDLTVPDIVACVSTYIESPNGFMARAERPHALRSSILGRVPPLTEGISCT